MVSRLFGILLLTGSLMFGAINVAQARPGNGFGNGNGGSSAPELDPTALGGGLAMLVGGILVLNERRRRNK